MESVPISLGLSILSLAPGFTHCSNFLKRHTLGGSSAQVIGFPSITWETWIVFWALGFGPTQPWSLWTFGE